MMKKGLPIFLLVFLAVGIFMISASFAQTVISIKDSGGGEEIKEMIIKTGTTGLKTDKASIVTATANVNELEPNDTPAAANTINIGDVANGVINPVGDLDYFRFQGLANQIVIIDIDASSLGSALDSEIFLYDIDGTTLLKQNDDSNGTDSKIIYMLPHAGQFFINVRDFQNNDGGAGYFYSLILKLMDKGIYGTVTFQNGEACEYTNFCVFNLDGTSFDEFNESSQGGRYCLDLPPGNYKIFAKSYDGLGGKWYNNKDSFSGADVVTVTSGSVIPNINFVLNKLPEINQVLNKYDFSTGETLKVNINVSNSLPIAIKGFCKVEVRYPDPGLKSTYPICRKINKYFDIITLQPNANFTITDFFTYTFTGGEPGGQYEVGVQFIPLIPDGTLGDAWGERGESWWSFNFTPSP